MKMNKKKGSGREQIQSKHAEDNFFFKILKTNKKLVC